MEAHAQYERGDRHLSSESTTHLRQLCSALPAGRNQTTLILGAGFHHLLAEIDGEALSSPARSAFASWSALIESVAKSHGLEDRRHSDPAANWEGLVCELATQQRIQASRAEAKLVSAAKKQLGHIPYSDNSLATIGRALLRRYGNIVSLNFDLAVARSLEAAGASQSSIGGQSERAGEHDIRFRHELKKGRAITTIWYPHGVIGSRATTILGSRNYGLAPAALADEFARYKNDLDVVKLRARQAYSESQWKEITNRTLEDHGNLSWFRLFMVCDLVFIGASMEAAEADLWWALHQRQRNLARVHARFRPKTLIAVTASSLAKSPHLCTSPADLRAACFENWIEAWRVILGLSAKALGKKAVRGR